MRPVPQCALDFIAGAEACRLVAYKDVGGVWTVGFGHVVSGPMTISQAQAAAYLYADATKAATRLAGVVTATAIQRLSDHQYGALVSFCFNLGANSSWSIWPLLNAGKLDAIPVQMMRFDKARINGQLVEVKGLFNRRAAEVMLWKTADVGAAITVAAASPVEAPPSGETVSVATPPTPMSPKPANRSKTFLTGLATTAAAGLAAAKDGLSGVKDAIAPYTADSTLLQGMVSHIALISAGLAVATVLFAYLKNRESQ